MKIAIVDFGGQYTHLIARRIRQLGVFSEVHNPDNFNHSDSDLVGIIFSGGPKSVTECGHYNVNFDIKKLKVPLLGICYGHQLIASILGGKVVSSKDREYGFTNIKCNVDSPLFKGLSKEQKVWMSHGDNVESLPDNFHIIAESDRVKISAYQSNDCKIFGVQFHPEVTHTEHGLTILENFVSLCTNDRSWKASNFVNTIIDEIKQKSQNKKLILLLSGGVDSLVALMLCIQAVGNDRVFSFHIDTGFMRKNESSDIIKYFENLGFKNIKVINAQNTFFENLKNVVNPEEKRKIIGKLFIDVLNEELQRIKLNEDWILVQGTIYPDTIESGGSKKSDKIKTHHNRVAQIENLIKMGRVIEPLKELYKDEVREVGKELNIPYKLINRHPFPGPGLAVRIIASDTDIPEDGYNAEYNELKEFLYSYNLDGMILPIKSVGVQGDSRTYHHPAVIWYKKEIKPDWNVLRECATKIVNNFKNINRVVFSIEKLDTELKLKKCYLDIEQVNLLREVDALINDITSSISEIWQMPIVSLPLWNQANQQAFVMRPVCSQDAMTADFYEMDFALLKKITERVKEINGVGNLFYDITTKPPATIEWE